MNILALETSCDETCCAIVEDGWIVRANVIASSLDLHKKTGGVVPEVAARAHIESIIPVVEEALEDTATQGRIVEPSRLTHDRRCRERNWLVEHPVAFADVWRRHVADTAWQAQHVQGF